MTKAQYEREKQQLARQAQIDLLAAARRRANLPYLIRAAGFWLERWQGKRHPTRGTHRKGRAA